MWPGDGPAACCVEHDVAYWCGGSAAARVQADAAFGACMRADARHSRHLGDLMYWSVRIGGTPWLPFPWRWGYGFAGVRGYDARP
jgi:hypothetical protein